MPIVKTPAGLLYFAHVPKCAGTSIEGYLGARFGNKQRALINPRYMRAPAHLRWSRSSPQHIGSIHLRSMFPENFFEGYFAVVRHPVVRLRSVFRYQRDAEAQISPDETFTEWLKELPGRWELDPWYLDNHPRPMHELVPEPCKVFRLEDGTDQIVTWIDQFVGSEGSPRSISHHHSFSERIQARGRTARAPVEICSDDIDLIKDLYDEDFSRFGYDSDHDTIQVFLNTAT